MHIGSHDLVERAVFSQFILCDGKAAYFDPVAADRAADILYMVDVRIARRPCFNEIAFVFHRVKVIIQLIPTVVSRVR